MQFSFQPVHHSQPGVAGGGGVQYWNQGPNESQAIQGDGHYVQLGTRTWRVTMGNDHSRVPPQGHYQTVSQTRGAGQVIFHPVQGQAPAPQAGPGGSRSEWVPNSTFYRSNQ